MIISTFQSQSRRMLGVTSRRAPKYVRMLPRPINLALTVSATAAHVKPSWSHEGSFVDASDNSYDFLRLRVE